MSLYFKQADSDFKKGPHSVIGSENMQVLVTYGGTYLKNHACHLQHANQSKLFFPLKIQSSFYSGDIQTFVFPPSPLFLPVSHCLRAWSKINVKVHDVINCLNKNLKTHFVWYLRKKKGMTLKLWPLIQY